MRALRLAAYELRRFRTPMQVAGLAFLALVPLLYGGIYLWSNWDPYDRIGELPVAVVNEDRPVQVQGRTVDAGGDFVRRLRSEHLVDMRETGAERARKGLREGDYYAVLTVPPDFSSRITSGAIGTPKQASMAITLNDANNYLVSVMAKVAQSELQRIVNESAVSAYFEAAFGKLAELRKGLGDAAGGAERLQQGLGEAQNGSSALAAGLGQAQQGTAALTDGLVQAKQGSGALANGLGQARQGTGALVGGVGAAKQGSAELAAGLGQAQRGTGALAAGLGQAKQGSGALATGLGVSGQGSAALAAGLGRAEQGSAALAGGAARLKRGTAELAPGTVRLSRGIHAFAGEAVPLAGRAVAGLPRLADAAVSASGEAAGLTALAAELSGRAARLATDLDRRLDEVGRRHPEIAGSAPFRRLREAVRAVDGTAGRRLSALAARYPAVARDPRFAAAAAAAKRLDATMAGRLNLLAGHHPELRRDPAFGDVLRLADRAAARARLVADAAARVNGRTRRLAADARRMDRQVPAVQRKLREAANGLVRLDQGGARLAAGARQADQGAGALLTGARTLDRGNARLANGARALNAGNARLLTGARALDNGNTRLLQGARTLDQGSTRLANGARALDNGNARLLQGARTLDQGSARLADGARRLDAGNARLLDGAQRLNAGSGELLAGAQKLNAGQGKLKEGAGKLASGLRSGEGRVPVPPADRRDRDAETLAQPVNVASSNLHPGGVYGRGLSPFFFGIALWVFGLVAYLMLRPLPGRLLASRAGSATVALASYLPALLIGLVGTGVLYASLELGLGLGPVHTAATLGVLALGVASFLGIVHLLRVVFGAAGDALALILLMLQLVSCGGLYPVETLPLPFQAVHRVVPMTYFDAALRTTIFGGEASHAWRDCGVLAGFLAGALVLLVLAVRRRRAWTMARLKPELEL